MENYIIMTALEHTICPHCGREIDPDVCWCGDSIKGHPNDPTHSPIPMGCDCGRDRLKDVDVPDFERDNP